MEGLLGGPSNPLRDFLVSRREEIDPASVGLARSSVPRRGRGLRRDDVATLAGMSVDYYARLEQGRIGNISDQVLSAVERALRLTAVERDHFRVLVGAQCGTASPRPIDPSDPRPALVELVRAMDPIPAVLQGPRMEVLAWNRAATILLTDFEAMRIAERNIARWLFLDPAARTRYPDWEDMAIPTVAALRAAQDPRIHDEILDRLVSELTLASKEFARYWAEYRVSRHGSTRKRIFHDAVGIMTLNFEVLHLLGDDGQFITAYQADVGSADEKKLRVLMS
ncbi:helix-turn-helix transcriptional regulator [Microbacterium sp. P05]|uniref:helix-turn-helix transcriptional regulator n=1 Tax=Microbacterium sp. P05 TaxID=3366948 RepID=UPI003744B7FA